MSADNLLPQNSLTVIRGASQTLKLAVTEPGTSDAVDLTGASVYFTVKKRVADPLPLLQKTNALAEDIDITAPRSGGVEIYLAPADTIRLDPGTYVFDVWVILADGKRHPVIPPSVFEVEAAVTVLPPG